MYCLFFHTCFNVFLYSTGRFRRKSRWLTTKSQPWSLNLAECCWKQISKEASPNLRKFGKVTLLEDRLGSGLQVRFWVMLRWNEFKLDFLTFGWNGANFIDLWNQVFVFTSLAKGAWLLVTVSWNGQWCQTCCFDMLGSIWFGTTMEWIELKQVRYRDIDSWVVLGDEANEQLVRGWALATWTMKLLPLATWLPTKQCSHRKVE